LNCKAKGNRAEYKTRRILEKAGYACTRAAASLGMFDVIAIGPRDIRLIQVKCARNASPVEREAIELFSAPANCSKEVWVWTDYARAPIVHRL
jgi:Holliday junction resolvase